MSVRDRLITALLQRGLRVKRIHGLSLTDVVTDPNAEFLEAGDRIPGGSDRDLVVDDALRTVIEDYLNAAHQGRPFLDYRPDIGLHLFPSPVTGRGLSRRTIRKALNVSSGEEEDDDDEEEEDPTPT